MSHLYCLVDLHNAVEEFIILKKLNSQVEGRGPYSSVKERELCR